MTIRNWGYATGLAAALALFGNAQAQSPGASNQTATGTDGREKTTTEDPGVRSGWSGTEANRAGTGSSASGAAASGSPGDTGSTTSGTATGSTASQGTASSGQASAGAQGQKVDKGLQEKLQKIHASNQAELHMAKMGQQQAQSAEVKEYARLLEEDHQRMDQELQQTAQAAGVQLEGKAFQDKQKSAMKDMDKLSKKSGQEFDKEFVSSMVKEHKKDVDAVKDASKDAKKANHTQLASTLDQAHSTMQGHLDRAKSLEDTLKQGGQRQGRAATSPGSGMGTGSGASDAGATPSGGAPGTSSDRRDTSRGDTGRGSSATGSQSDDASSGKK